MRYGAATAALAPSFDGVRSSTMLMHDEEKPAAADPARYGETVPAHAPRPPWSRPLLLLLLWRPPLRLHLLRLQRS